jgi:diketogulonate reductase-like aldo/keto reductase
LEAAQDVVPIPGTTNPRLLLENMAAPSIGLTAEERAELRHRPPGVAAGDRYPAAMIGSLGR